MTLADVLGFRNDWLAHALLYASFYWAVIFVLIHPLDIWAKIGNPLVRATLFLNIMASLSISLVLAKFL